MKMLKLKSIEWGEATQSKHNQIGFATFIQFKLLWNQTEFQFESFMHSMQSMNVIEMIWNFLCGQCKAITNVDLTLMEKAFYFFFSSLILCCWRVVWLCAHGFDSLYFLVRFSSTIWQITSMTTTAAPMTEYTEFLNPLSKSCLMTSNG